MGKILTVDLAARSFRRDPLDRWLTDRLFGGRGLGIALLVEHFKTLEKQGKYHNAVKEVDPLSPDNLVVFTTTPTTGLLP